MTLSDLYRKVKGICGCLNSADVPLKCNGNDFNVDFEIKSKNAIVSHVEVKQYPALTWEDVNLIDSILIDMQDEGVERYGGLRQYYEEAIKRFNEKKNE